MLPVCAPRMIEIEMQTSSSAALIAFFSWGLALAVVEMGVEEG